MSRGVLIFIVFAFAVMAAAAEFVFSGRTVHGAGTAYPSLAPVTSRRP